ncbi:MAG: zinc ribbon domain-containing protein [Calditrichaeota bacterium]|nr:zinc ribbon domain-containing protein [Calditrichota bacterium]
MGKVSFISVCLIFCFVLLGLLSLPVLAGEDNPNEVTCSECGYVNDSSNKFCIDCGTLLKNEKQKLTESPVSPKPATIEVGMSRLFHLRDGNVVQGTITEIEGDSVAVIDTPDGVLRIPAWEILEEAVDVIKHDDTHFAGPVLSEDDFSISVKTPYGVVVILKRDVQSMERYYGDKRVTWKEEKQRFYPVEELMDIFMDPTAFPLQPHVTYLSGLSLGYGFTENMTLRTQFGHNFTGDLNLHPIYRFYHRTTGTSELSIAIGTELFSRHPMKLEAEKYSHWILDKTGPTDIRMDEQYSKLVDEILIYPDVKEFFGSFYLVMSKRQSLQSGRGKWGWHLGAATNSLGLSKPELLTGYKWDKDFVVPYRMWVAMDYDLTKKLKFLFEVFADNGYKYITLEETWNSYFDFEGTPFTIATQHGDYQPVDLDFGFLWSLTETFRLGVHFQSPYVTFYWKF